MLPAVERLSPLINPWKHHCEWVCPSYTNYTSPLQDLGSFHHLWQCQSNTTAASVAGKVTQLLPLGHAGTQTGAVEVTATLRLGTSLCATITTGPGCNITLCSENLLNKILCIVHNFYIRALSWETSHYACGRKEIL